jgi:hypothetical protein
VGGRRAGWPMCGFSAAFLAHDRTVSHIAHAEASHAAAGNAPLGAPEWPVRASRLTDVMRNASLELQEAPGLKRLLDPQRPGAFLACCCGSEHQTRHGSCIQRLYVLDREWLTFTSH